MTLAPVDGCLRNCTHRMLAATPRPMPHKSVETKDADSRMSATNHRLRSAVGLLSDPCKQQCIHFGHVKVKLTNQLQGAEAFLRNWFSAIQVIPRISRNPKVHYRIHNSLPPVPILGQADPAHAFPHPTSLRSIVILSFHLRLGLPSGLLPSGFPTKTQYATIPPPYALHALPISVFLI